MKKILIIDESELYREFLQAKLASFGMDVTIAQNGLDGSIKLRQDNWDLVIMDYYLSRASCLDLLEAKSRDPNIRQVPVIVAGNKINRDSIIKLSLLGVKKIFNKPVRIDSLTSTIGEILGLKLELDTTPCMIEANLNDDILLVEVALGLNPDKVELLKFRLKELMELHDQRRTKVLLIMSGLELDSNDSLTFHSLISTILEYTRVSRNNFKILASNEMVKTFLRAKESHSDLEVLPTLELAMDRLSGTGNDPGMADQYQAGDRLARSAAKGSIHDLDMVFDHEIRQNAKAYFDISMLDAGVSVAVVDDDPIIRQIINKAFAGSPVTVALYSDGDEFLADDPGRHDLVFLDLMMPRVDGFSVLETLRARSIVLPIIILSALSKKETVIKALKYGVKSYAIKPVLPQEVQRKALEILRMNF